MELFMTANVFDCIDVVNEGIATKENRYDRMDEQSPYEDLAVLSEARL
jgi:hypothetical protein